MIMLRIFRNVTVKISTGNRAININTLLVTVVLIMIRYVTVHRLDVLSFAVVRRPRLDTVMQIYNTGYRAKVNSNRRT